MTAIPLKAEERNLLGKKVKQLRRNGVIPAHVYGNKVETEHVSVDLREFMKVFKEAGETGLVDLKIGAEKVRPVLIRNIQVDPLRGEPVHIDFYQVNLKEKVTVPVPIVLIGEEPEAVHSGEAIVIQPMSEVQVEALPAELPEKIEVDIVSLKQIDDAITVAQLVVPEGVTILAEPEAVVVKLDTAVSAEAQQLMEEQAAEQEAQAEAAEGEGAAEETTEKEGEEGQEEAAGETPEESTEE